MSPDRWLVLTVRVPSEELGEELAEGLIALGGTAVEQEVDLLTSYFPEPDDPEAFLRDAADRLDERVGGAAEVIWRWQDDEDWSARWKEGLEPRRVGPRVVVTQPWNAVEAGPEDLVIAIEPASAFGTGEHATTRGALRLLQRAVRGGERVLDVGAGSGILSIAAVRLGADRAVAVESDAGAMATAAANLARNGVRDVVDLRNAVVDAAYLEADRGGGFDLIVANVLSGVLVPLLRPMAAALRPGGRVILGGILASEVEDVTAAAVAARLVLEAEDREEEWWTGLLRRP